MKALRVFILGAFLLTGCQIQINLASSVVNVPVVKGQYESPGADMSGSKLEDIAEGMKQEGGDVTGVP